MERERGERKREGRGEGGEREERGKRREEERGKREGRGEGGEREERGKRRGGARRGEGRGEGREGRGEGGEWERNLTTHFAKVHIAAALKNSCQLFTNTRLSMPLQVHAHSPGMMV